MSRKDALLRIHKSLVEKRDALRRQLASELDEAHSSAHSGDLLDAALDGTNNEMHSQLAAFESRELQQIERAIRMIRAGHYGDCEICGEKIPVARLKALPYATVCIDCRQKQERSGRSFDNDSASWETAFEFEGAQSDRELTIRDIDIAMD
jgi:DnaK suppressor protein